MLIMSVFHLVNVTTKEYKIKPVQTDVIHIDKYSTVRCNTHKYSTKRKSTVQSGKVKYKSKVHKTHPQLYLDHLWLVNASSTLRILVLWN